MTLFKTAIRNLKKDLIMNMIGFVQLVAVFLVTTVMASTLSIRYRCYDPLEDILSSKGFYVNFNDMFGAKREGFDPDSFILAVDDLNSYTQADSVINVKGDWVCPATESSDTHEPLLMFYDNELIERCKPVIKSGRWVSPDSDKLEVVITDNNGFGWKLGDTVDLQVVQVATSRFIEVEVVGIIEESSEIFGYNRFEDKGTFRFLYDTHNSHNKNSPELPTMISSAEALERLFPDVTTQIFRSFFIYSNDTPDEFIKEKSMAAAQLNADVVLDLEALNSNSKEYLRGELFKMMPVIVILLILVVISAVSVSAIAARRRLKDYAKYYVLGLQWKQCAIVNFLQALTTAAAALIISAAALFVIRFTGLSDVITIIINTRLAAALLGIFALYLVFSMIMPLIMLNSATPKELLQTE